MMFDTTGLTEIKMKKHLGRQGSYYLDGDSCVAKTCSSCEVILSSNEFGLCSAKKFKLTSDCLTCRSKYFREYASSPSTDGNSTSSAERSILYYTSNTGRTDEQIQRDRNNIRPTGSKKCTTCQTELPLSEYSNHRGRADGLAQTCKTCQTIKDANRHTNVFLSYWVTNNIPIRCYLCDGPFEEVEHLIPTSLHGNYGPINTRPACIDCNRGSGGKHDKPLETYIFQVNHPTKPRSQILHEIVMSGVWPFANTSPEEFVHSSNMPL